MNEGTLKYVSAVFEPSVKKGKNTRHVSGQNIVASHNFTPKCSLVREIPLFQGNLGWWNIMNHLARCLFLLLLFRNGKNKTLALVCLRALLVWTFKMTIQGSKRVFPNIGVGPPNHPLKNRVFHYFHHQFWGVKTHYSWVDTQKVYIFMLVPCDSRLLSPLLLLKLNSGKVASRCWLMFQWRLAGETKAVD